MLATVSATRTNNLLGSGESTASALTSGYHLAFLIGAALVVVGIVVAVLVIEPVKHPQAAHAAEPEAEAEHAHREPVYSDAG